MELIWLKDVEIIFLNFLQALFDKKTVMGEIQASKQGSVCPNMPKSVPKLKHDENVLESAPPMYRQILLPFPSEKEFLTGGTYHSGPYLSISLSNFKPASFRQRIGSALC